MAEQSSIRHRAIRWIVVAGVVFFCVLVLGTVTGHFQTIAWSGRRILQVRVCVIDGAADSPIVNAKIVVFDGPFSVHDGPFRGVRLLRPEDRDTASKTALTDDDGLAIIDYEFFAAGMTGPLRRTGHIRMNDRWVRVDADGYSRVTLPLDGQSMRQRDLDDDRPIFITVVLAKQR